MISFNSINVIMILGPLKLKMGKLGLVFNLYVFYIRYQRKRNTTAQPNKLELVFSEVVPAGVNGYALVLKNILISNRADGQNTFVLTKIGFRSLWERSKIFRIFFRSFMSWSFSEGLHDFPQLNYMHDNLSFQIFWIQKVWKIYKTI